MLKAILILIIFYLSTAFAAAVRATYALYYGRVSGFYALVQHTYAFFKGYVVHWIWDLRHIYQKEELIKFLKRWLFSTNIKI